MREIKDGAIARAEEKLPEFMDIPLRLDKEKEK